MAWVYMLRGSSARFYIGSTTDLYRRLAQHQLGMTYSARRLGLPLELVAAKQLDSLAEARRLERQLKHKNRPMRPQQLLAGVLLPLYLLVLLSALPFVLRGRVTATTLLSR